MFVVLKEILISEKDFTKTNYERLKKALVYIKNDLINFDGNIYLAVDSLIEINNIIIRPNIALRKVNVEVKWI